MNWATDGLMRLADAIYGDAPRPMISLHQLAAVASDPSQFGTSQAASRIPTILYLRYQEQLSYRAIGAQFERSGTLMQLNELRGLRYLRHPSRQHEFRRSIPPAGMA